MKKRILVIIGAAYYNRGSEALLKGLIQICNEDKSYDFAVSSADLKNNGVLPIEHVNEFLPRYNKIFNNRKILRLLNYVRRIIGFSDLITRITCSKLIKRSSDFDLIIVIGADNLDSKVPCKRELNSLIDILSKRNAKLILYDCSIQEKNINKFLLKNLSNCDVVTARDTISFENLRKYKEKNLYYIPDPAFVIEPTKIDFGLLNDSTYVGLNLSNKVTGPKGTDRYSLIINSYHKLIEYITNTLKMKVILIPHVMNNADLSVLADLYIKYKETRQVFLIENEGLSSNELKYIISKCRYFVGARTHSTIAAYSSCVPTLVLGYSIKSIGIAKDLFSTDKNYVILSSELKNSDTLLNGFKWLIENEISIRESLLNTMDEYSKSAWKFYDIVKNILK